MIGTMITVCKPVPPQSNRKKKYSVIYFVLCLMTIKIFDFKSIKSALTLTLTLYTTNDNLKILP